MNAHNALQGSVGARVQGWSESQQQQRWRKNEEDGKEEEMVDRFALALIIAASLMLPGKF